MFDAVDGARALRCSEFPSSRPGLVDTSRARSSNPTQEGKSDGGGGGAGGGGGGGGEA